MPIKRSKLISFIILFPKQLPFWNCILFYQFEGAFLNDGKGLRNWDLFTHKPGHSSDGTNGDIPVDQYHLYLIKLRNFEPERRFGRVNKAGIGHYNKFINALVHRGIQPFVTLTHYGIPQSSGTRRQIWSLAKSQSAVSYSLGTVRFWVTFNEPNVAVIRGYRSGIYPPSRCSISFGNCTAGDSEREPFIAAHNIILSHAASVNIYQTKYQKKKEVALEWS